MDKLKNTFPAFFSCGLFLFSRQVGSSPLPKRIPLGLFVFACTKTLKDSLHWIHKRDTVTGMHCQVTFLFLFQPFTKECNRALGPLQLFFSLACQTKLEIVAEWRQQGPPKDSLHTPGREEKVLPSRLRLTQITENHRRSNHTQLFSLPLSQAGVQLTRLLPITGLKTRQGENMCMTALFPFS